MLINTACESGGTGRRARLRGVWETVRVRFPSLAPTKKTETIDSVFFVGISGVEFNSSLEHLCSRIGVAFLTEQRLPLASNLVGKNSS